MFCSFELLSFDRFFSLDNLVRGSKEISSSGKWFLSDGGTFQAFDRGEGYSMIKVTASHVDFDGQSLSISRNGVDDQAIVGIEVGYTPAELAADSSLVQPTNITIKNITLANFDCGLVIHQGVSEVIIENCYFFQNSIGVLSIGQNGVSHQNDIFNITLHNITVIGVRNLDKQSSLVNMKQLVEVNYGYPLELFMKLRTDPLNNDAQDVYTYYGMCFIYSDNVNLKNIIIQDVGYSEYSVASEGNGRRTESIGIAISNSRRFFIDDISCNDCRSEIKCVGLQLDNVVRMRVKNGIFSHNLSNVKVAGVEVRNDSGLDYSIDEVRFENVSCEANVGGKTAIGMDLTASRGFAGYGLVCKFNQGGEEAYGIYTKKAQALLLRDDTTLTTNYATRMINDVATEKGIVAAGFYGENVLGMQVEKISCIGMQAFNTAYGMYLKNSISIRLEESQFSANVSFLRRSGEESAIRAEQDAQEISKFAPSVDATSTGSYGLYVVNGSKINIRDCIMVSNLGHRSAGVTIRNGSTIGIFDSLISAQIGTGSKLDQSFYDDNVANPRSYIIQPAHKSLLFSDFTKSTVDLVQTTDLFLSKAVALRARQAAGLEPLYDDVTAFLATGTLLQAAIARYRLWGSSFGIHIHNAQGCLLRNNTCVDNLSYYDTGVGICFSGRCAGQLVQDSNVSYNQGWSKSAQSLGPVTAQYNYQYDLSQDKWFWETLTTPWTNYRTIDNGSGFNILASNPASTLIATGDANNQVKIWNINDGSLVTTLTDHTAPVTALAWSPDGTQLATGAQSSSSNIVIYNSSDWSLDRSLTCGSVGVNALAWSPDSERLVAGSSDLSNNFVVYNTSNYNIVGTSTHGSAVYDVAWNNSSDRVLSASENGSIYVMERQSLSWSTDQTINAHTGAVNAVRYNHDFSLFASASSDNTVKVWNSSSYTLEQTLTDHTDDVTFVRFSSDSTKLFAGSIDHSVKVWSTSTWGGAIQTLSGHTGALTGIVNYGLTSFITTAADGLLKWWYTDTWKVANDRDTAGIYIAEGGFLAQGQKDFGDGTSGDNITISADGINNYPLVSPIGSIGAGIVLGDFIIDAYVKNNQIHYNVGNAGSAHSILMNQSYYSVVESNLIEGAVSSVYGFCSGVLDVTAHSSNTFLKNLFESNKISSFVNANYMIPFNPTDTNTLVFPVFKMLNGSFNQPATEFDNIVMEYSQNDESYHVESLVNPSLHPDLKSLLTSNNCWS